MQGSASKSVIGQPVIEYRDPEAQHRLPAFLHAHDLGAKRGKLLGTSPIPGGHG